MINARALLGMEDIPLAKFQTTAVRDAEEAGSNLEWVQLEFNILQIAHPRLARRKIHQRMFIIR